jgi:hypothetical protein
MTDQDWTKEDNEEFCRAIGITKGNHKLVGEECRGDDVIYFTCSCGKKTADCNDMAHHFINSETLPNFSSPSDKELGMMLDWCLKENIQIEIFTTTFKPPHQIGCRLKYAFELKRDIETAPTKELAIRAAIMAYGKEGVK